LERQGYVTIIEDPADRRRRRVALTRTGKVEASKLANYLDRLDRVYETLFEEIGLDALIAVRSATQAMDDLALDKPIGR